MVFYTLFFFQAEDGIRDWSVTGVQTCALPISITYDDATGLVIFGTAGADVGYGEMTGVKITGEKLFSQCIIAVKADTGEYVWHFQTGTEGVHSENNQIMMADVTINGEKRHVVMTAAKTGFF